MAKYRVVESFYDLQDPVGMSYHLYNAGDAYPREGMEPSPGRIEYLLSGGTRRGEPVIEEDTGEPAGESEGACAEGAEAAPEEMPEETPVPAEAPAEEEAKPKRRRRAKAGPAAKE